MGFELVVTWWNGETNIYTYDTKEEAEASMEGMHMAFGNQIMYACIRPKHFLGWGI